MTAAAVAVAIASSTAPADAEEVPGTPPPGSTKPIPPGYKLESGPRTGLMITGALLALGGGALAVGGAVVGEETHDEWLRWSSVSAGSVIAATGLVLVLIGAASPKHQLVRIDSPQEPSADAGLPPVLPAEKGMPPPPGYHRETRPRTGLLVAGGIVAGVGTALIGAAAVRSATDEESNVTPVYAVGGACMAAGLPLLAVALLGGGREVYARDVEERSSAANRLLIGPWRAASAGGVVVRVGLD